MVRQFGFNSMGELAIIGVNLLIPILLLVIAYVIGSQRESNHLKSIKHREYKTRQFPTLTFRDPPPGWGIESSELVIGSVVISLDYFKRFLASLRGLVGGQVGSYETLLDRARRESVLRMKELAIAKGHHAIINVRFETSRLASSGQDGHGTAGVELMAFGTALTLVRKSDGDL